MALQRTVSPMLRLKMELALPKLAPFGTDAPSTAANLTALLTNMVRTEIGGIFREIELLAPRAHFLSVAEYPNLDPWLKDCELCVRVALQELQKIFTITETRVANMDMFPRRERQLCIEDIRISLLNVVRTQAPRFRYEEALHRFQNLYLGSLELNKGLEYMNFIDRKLPELISEAFTHHEVHMMQKAVMKSLLSKLGELRDVRGMVDGWKKTHRTGHLIPLRVVRCHGWRKHVCGGPRWRSLELAWRFMWGIARARFDRRTKGAVKRICLPSVGMNTRCAKDDARPSVFARSMMTRDSDCRHVFGGRRWFTWPLRIS